MDEPYRGPDRRPAPPERSAPPLALTGGAAAGAAAAALVDAADPAGAQAAVAAVVGVAPLVVATVLLLCAWRVGGRSRPAHAAVALALAGGAGPLTAWLASGAAGPSAAAQVSAVALAAGLAAAAPHARAARRAPQVSTDLRPGTALLSGCGLVLAAGAGAAALLGAGSPPLVPSSLGLTALAQAPWSLAWTAALGALGGVAVTAGVTSLRSALRAQHARGLRAVAGLHRSSADLAEDRLRRHDARSALAAVRAASAVLTGQQPAVLDTAARRDLAAAVHAELSRVERLLAEPGTACAAAQHPGVVDLREAAAPLVTAWRARGLDVTGPPPGPPVLALGSADAVRRAVANLLDNAQRHAPGSAVRITAGPSDGGGVAVVVHDDGPGVPGAAREAVFAVGARLSEDTGGLGLGLASARALAEADGGSLRLLDTPRGARFELRLPPARTTHVPQEVTAR